MAGDDGFVSLAVDGFISKGKRSSFSDVLKCLKSIIHAAAKGSNFIEAEGLVAHQGSKHCLLQRQRQTLYGLIF